jgi:hypothetical protein
MTQHRHTPVKTQDQIGMMCSTCRKVLSPIYEKRRRTRILHNYRKLAQSLRIHANEVESAFGYETTYILECASRLEQDATTIKTGGEAI